MSYIKQRKFPASKIVTLDFALLAALPAASGADLASWGVAPRELARPPGEGGFRSGPEGALGLLESVNGGAKGVPASTVASCKHCCLIVGCMNCSSCASQTCCLWIACQGALPIAAEQADSAWQLVRHEQLCYNCVEEPGVDGDTNDAL